MGSNKRISPLGFGVGTISSSSVQTGFVVPVPVPVPVVSVVVPVVLAAELPVLLPLGVPSTALGVLTTTPPKFANSSGLKPRIPLEKKPPNPNTLALLSGSPGSGPCKPNPFPPMTGLSCTFGPNGATDWGMPPTLGPKQADRRGLQVVLFSALL